jgi:hypothetical protein
VSDCRDCDGIIEGEVKHPARAVAVAHSPDRRDTIGLERGEHFVEGRARVLRTVVLEPPSEVESLHEAGG